MCVQWYFKSLNNTWICLSTLIYRPKWRTAGTNRNYSKWPFGRLSQLYFPSFPICLNNVEFSKSYNLILNKYIEIGKVGGKNIGIKRGYNRLWWNQIPFTSALIIKFVLNIVWFFYFLTLQFTYLPDVRYLIFFPKIHEVG